MEEKKRIHSFDCACTLARPPIYFYKLMSLSISTGFFQFRFSHLRILQRNCPLCALCTPHAQHRLSLFLIAPYTHTHTKLIFHSTWPIRSYYIAEKGNWNSFFFFIKTTSFPTSFWFLQILQSKRKVNIYIGKDTQTKQTRRNWILGGMHKSKIKPSF